MNTTKIVAVVCAFSTLLIGCYSSVLIDPTGDEKGKMYKNDIEMVQTKDGSGYTFYEPPKIDSTAIVGMRIIKWGSSITKEQVSIPLSDVQVVQVSQFDSISTIYLAITVFAVSGCIVAIVNNRFW